jgi:hypothetical protein
VDGIVCVVVPIVNYESVRGIAINPAGRYEMVDQGRFVAPVIERERDVFVAQFSDVPSRRFARGDLPQHLHDANRLPQRYVHAST